MVRFGLRRHRLHAAQQIGRVLLFRQHRAQVREARFEVLHLGAELGQLLRRREALVDVGAQRVELQLARGHVGAQRHLVVVVEGADAHHREDQEGDDLAVPGKFAETDIHGGYTPLRGAAALAVVPAGAGLASLSPGVLNTALTWNLTISPVAVDGLADAADDFHRALEVAGRFEVGDEVGQAR